MWGNTALLVNHIWLMWGNTALLVNHIWLMWGNTALLVNHIWLMWGNTALLVNHIWLMWGNTALLVNHIWLMWGTSYCEIILIHWTFNWSTARPPALVFMIYASLTWILIIIWKPYRSIIILLTNYRTRW